ncbi:small-conductance mechanosensitive channel [Paraburkholderia sp. GAS333]|uniref:mechanosensitive ion channel domain-containing protein n=1 Tax=Paraburkholderia sp. GAS333 TaxID=3156279 RepID=UPI003D241175
MPTLTNGALYAAGILILDFLAWRFMDSRKDLLRFLIRALMFALSTYILFSSGISPLRAAPWPADPFRHLLAQVLELVWWLQGARLVIIVLDRVVLPEAWHRERLFQDVLGALVFLAATVGAIAFVLQLPVKGLLATSGALAVVLGLAIQSTLNDVFSGAVLNATQPFRLGDWVTIGDAEGKVIESNWRATSLLNGQGNLVVIPNSVAARANIVNANQPPHTHGISVVLALSPAIRPALVLSALANAALSSTDVLTDPKASANVRRATNDAIEYEIVCFVDSLDKTDEVRNRLYDFAYRHLLSRGVTLHSLSVAEQGTPGADGKRILLRNVPIFQTLNDGELAELTARLITHEFDAGQTIYTASDESAHDLHIIARGVAKVTVRKEKEGEEVESRRLSPGDAIGQLGILAGVASAVVARALTRVTVYQLDKSVLTSLLTRRPEVAKEMCRLVSAHLASEELLFANPPEIEQSESGVLQWIRDGVKRFHQLQI